MIAYHFTTQSLYPRIEREGLTLGGVPWGIIPQHDGSSKVRMMRGLQWLTVDPEFDTQAWSKVSKGICGAMMRKNDWRITINIPNLAAYKLFSWPEFAAHHRLEFSEVANRKFGKAHTQHWRIFNGNIPTGWFLETLQNPELRNLVQEFENN